MAKRVTGALALVGVLLLSLPASGQEATTYNNSDKESLVRVLRTSNKAQTNKFVSEVLEFENVNPFNIVNFFWAATSREEGGVFTYKHPDAPGGLMVVICPEYQLESLRQLARDLDRPGVNSAPGSRYTYYRMKHRSATDPGLRSSLALWVGPQGVLLPDVETNSLLIFDAPTSADDAEQALVEFLDVPLEQVEVAVTIYEISVRNDAALGLDFEAWKNGPGKALVQIMATGEYIAMRNQDTRKSNASAGGVYFAYPSAFFDFLVAKGKGRVVTSTRLTAVNQMTSELSSGDRILYFKENETAQLQTATGQTVFNREMNAQTLAVESAGAAYEFATSGPRPRPGSVASIDTGVTFAVRPTIGQETIGLDVFLTVANVMGYDSSGAPVVSTRQIADTLSVRDGEEVMFGGLTRQRQVQTARKVPILGSIPILGYLFGGETTMQQESLIVTSVRPVRITGGTNRTPADGHLADKASGRTALVIP